MKTLRCAPPGALATEIRIGCDHGHELTALLGPQRGGRQVLTMVDGGLRRARPDVVPAQAAIELPAGEAAKTFAVLEDTLRRMARLGIARGTVVVALGGGATGDLAGLAAALYARGLDLILVPTTLLAMVDSSVGGKTAIDLPEGKNLVGAFHPASHVLCDLGFLATLPPQEIRSGLGEVIKVALGLDAELFALLEREADAMSALHPPVLAEVIERAVAAKIRVVEEDWREQGARRLLNLGHTVGHALEAWSGYRIAHGEAVARGIHHAIGLAEADGVMAAADAARARALLERYGFEATPLPPPDELLPFLRRDKKVVHGSPPRLHWVLPTGIGTSTVAARPLA